MSGFTGGCMCGNIRFESTTDPVMLVQCHCRECQYSSGAGHSNIVVGNKADFRVTKGSPKGYSKTPDAGGTVTRFFCADCGTPLFSESTNNKDMSLAKAAAVDDTSKLSVNMTLWASEAPVWDHVEKDGIPCFEKNPG